MAKYLHMFRDGTSFAEVLASLESDLPFPPPPPRPKHKTAADVYRWVDENWGILTGPYDDAFEDFFAAREEGLITKDEFDRACKILDSA